MHAAVDIGEVAAVRPLRIDVAVVRAVALVDRVARRRRDVVALLGAGHVPAAKLDRLRRIAHIDAAVELVVVRMRRLEVRRAGGAMDVFAVAEPELVHAARGRPRAVEERDRARLLRHRDVEQLHAGRLLALLLGLVGDRHDVAADLKRIRAHVLLRQVGLHHHLGVARIGDIDRGEILRRALMRQPDDAAPVGRDLHRHALAHAAEAVQLVLGQQLEIPEDRLVLAGPERAFFRDGHVVLLDCAGRDLARLGPAWKDLVRGTAMREMDSWRVQTIITPLAAAHSR